MRERPRSGPLSFDGADTHVAPVNLAGDHGVCRFQRREALVVAEEHVLQHRRRQLETVERLSFQNPIVDAAPRLESEFVVGDYGLEVGDRLRVSSTIPTVSGPRRGWYRGKITGIFKPIQTEDGQCGSPFQPDDGSKCKKTI